jgi:hypothetical protein
VTDVVWEGSNRLDLGTCSVSNSFPNAESDGANVRLGWVLRNLVPGIGRAGDPSTLLLRLDHAITKTD